MTSNTADWTEVDLETIALHEAGHAVMRWLQGLPASELTATSSGGFCAGNGRPIHSESNLLVLVAGYAVESGYGIFGPPEDLESHEDGDDFDLARRQIANCEWLRFRARFEADGQVTTIVQSVDDALVRYFLSAGEQLRPYSDSIERIGCRLADEGRLSARTVAAMCREHARFVARVDKGQEKGGAS